MTIDGLANFDRSVVYYCNITGGLIYWTLRTTVHCDAQINQRPFSDQSCPRRGVLMGQGPQIKIRNTTLQIGVLSILQCQAPLHKCKAPCWRLWWRLCLRRKVPMMSTNAWEKQVICQSGNKFPVCYNGKFLHLIFWCAFWYFFQDW